MSLQRRFVGSLAARGVAHCLTGRQRDLELLLALARVPIPNPVLAAFLARLARDLRDESGLARILLHAGRHVNARSKRKLIENLFFKGVVEGRSRNTGTCSASTPDPAARKLFHLPFAHS